ncbi:MAG: serine/threonine-protein kinase [Gemmatimonadetes bacterium]|nr:serine/threonine-protein kinase [Gemmatimonadota bacterium]
MSDVLARLKTALADRYAIERELGRGGMATVYLAEDLKHDRKVAVKVLHPELAAILGAERFLQEIKVTANLQHPHILPLFDSGRTDGVVYYVMPYVDGESLRGKLNREKQLPIPEAVRIATEVAGALDYAHRHNVIHRDIKPENILLHDGRAVVADFGIALAVRNAGGQRMTETGLSLGTPEYMSPEQAAGEREIDGRTDIYALGCVLYEMLAGGPAHSGPTVQAIIAKIITEKPPHVREARDTVPDYIDRALTQALAKLPADRFSSGAQFAEALARSMPTDPGRYGSPGTGRWPRAIRISQRDAVVTALAILLTSVATWAFFRGRSGRDTVSLSILPPAGVHFEPASGEPAIAISRDGKRLVFVGTDGVQRRLYTRRLDQTNAIPLAGTEDATGPVFSPDGEWIGFFAGGTFKRIPAGGGAPEVVAELRGTNHRGATWTRGNDLLIATNNFRGLDRVSARGGPVNLVTQLDTASGEISHRFPEALDDDRVIATAVLASEGRSRTGIVGLSLKSGRHTVLIPNADLARYAAPGYLIAAEASGALLAARFDPKGLEVKSPIVPVLDSVSVTSGGAAQMAISATGTLAYLRGSGLNEIALIGSDGTEQVVSAEPRRYGGATVSPDGQRLAVIISTPGYDDLWLYDRDQGSMTRLTADYGASVPVWSPDGRMIAYSQFRGGGLPTQLKGVAADGSQAGRDFFGKPAIGSTLSWTPDGRIVVFIRPDSTRRNDLWTAAASGADEHPIARTPFDERDVRVSSDGRWIAFTSNDTGRDEVYVQSLAGGARQLVSANGGSAGRWARNAPLLFYREGNQIMSVTVIPGSRLGLGPRRAVFKGAFSNYDVYPDGKTLVVTRPVDRSLDLVVVLNWLDDVERRLAARR